MRMSPVFLLLAELMLVLAVAIPTMLILTPAPDEPWWGADRMIGAQRPPMVLVLAADPQPANGNFPPRCWPGQPFCMNERGLSGPWTEHPVLDRMRELGMFV